jgi:tetratricopeptide (TPR) repeat protein
MIVPQKIIRLLVLEFSVCLLMIFLNTSCTATRFPVVRPINEQTPIVYSQAKAQEYFIRARDYERRGLLKMAAREYENALQFDPNSRFLKQQLLGIYIESDKYAQAILLVKNGRKNEELNREEKRTLSTIYLKMSEFEKAAWILESINNKTVEELYTLGWIYEHLGNFKKALNCYLRYFHEKPEELQLGFKIAKMLLQLKNYVQADSFLVALQDTVGTSPDIFNLRGTVALVVGDTSRSLALLDSSLLIDSLHEETLRNKAQIFIERADFIPAITCYQKLVHSFTYGDIYIRTLALLYYYNQQYADAEKLLQQILPLSMNDPQLHYYLGLVYSATGKYDLAEIEFEKSLTIKKDDDDAWRELCSVFIKNKSIDQAAAIADRYTNALPNNKSSWRLKGYVATIQKNYPVAIASYKQAVHLDSLDAFSWFELGSVLERSHALDSSEKAFYKVLALRPNDPGTLNYLGYMWAEKGVKLDSAQHFLEMALNKEPGNGAFLDSYAWILYQMGKYDSAHVYMMKAIEHIYDDPVIFSHLGDILTKQGDFNNALSSFKKSIELKSEDDAAIRKKMVDLEILLQNE